MGKITFSFRMVYASKYIYLRPWSRIVTNPPLIHPLTGEERILTRVFIVINYEWDNLKYLLGFEWNFHLGKLFRQLSLSSSLNTRSFYLWEIFIWIMSVKPTECWLVLLLIVCLLLFLCVLCWKRFPYSGNYWGFMVFECEFIRVV